MLLLPPCSSNPRELWIKKAKLDTALLGEVDVVNPLHTVHQLIGQNLLAFMIIVTDLDEECPSTFPVGPSAVLMSVAGRIKAEVGKHMSST